MSEPDVYVVGSGPNGLTAAIEMARAGRRVHVLEAAPTPGGGTRTKELIEPGTGHDVCSAIHPLARASAAWRDLPLGEHGLEWLDPDVEVAHVLDGGAAAVLHRDLDATADGLGPDAAAYRRALARHVAAGQDLIDGVLDPLAVPPRHPLHLARFALAGLGSAQRFVRRFRADPAAALFAGLAAHAIQPLDRAITAGTGLLFATLGHTVGWPQPVGGSQRIADALVSVLAAHGGTVECGTEVTSLDGFAPGATVLLDVTPRQFVRIAGDRLPVRYVRRLTGYRYGPGAFKVDYLLSEPIPWRDPDAHRAGTVHVGGTFAEVAESEATVAAGHHPERPFVLVAQPTVFDPSRSVAGRHVAWAYCHVPNGSAVDMTAAIERQIERFAPGFGDVVLGRHTIGARAFEAYDANYVGGDIAGGAADLRQFFARPVLSTSPWRTPLTGVYLCSSSTPPGAGVHGMCGWHAARAALADARRGRLSRRAS